MITCSNSSAVAFPVRCSVMGPEPSRTDPNRSTTSASVRAAATGSLAPATAEITATPAAPASSTSAAFEAAIPPIPTTGMVVALTTSASPSGPCGTASGFVAVAQTVTPR